jgi:hypothetical protein
MPHNAGEPTVTYTSSPRPLAAVVPIVDYEPPPVSDVPSSSQAREVRRPARQPRLRHLRVAQEPPRRPAAGSAAMFAEAALRHVLEVIDRRRPVAQLRPLVADGLIDTVVALADTRHAATAMLRRVRLRVVDRDGEAAEVFATYSRGERVRAIAGRVELEDARDRRRWRIVALQIG